INSKYGDTCEFCNEQLQVAGGAGRSSNAPQFSSAPTPSTLAPSGEMLNKSGGGSKEPQFPSAPERTGGAGGGSKGGGGEGAQGGFTKTASEAARRELSHRENLWKAWHKGELKPNQLLAHILSHPSCYHGVRHFDGSKENGWDGFNSCAQTG